MRVSSRSAVPFCATYSASKQETRLIPDTAIPLFEINVCVSVSFQSIASAN